MNTSFATLLRRYRTAAGLTQEELAERASLSRRSISNMERGVPHRPRKDTIDLLVEALGLSEADRRNLAVRESQELNVDAVKSGRPPGLRDSQHLVTGGFLGSLPTNALVARNEEMAHILSSVETVMGGEGRLVMLAGEPGVGKTRLAQEVTVAVHQRGFLLATGRCYEPQRAAPFFPFLDLLAMLYDAAPPSVQDETPRRWPYLARLLPDQLNLGPLPASESSEDQQRLFWTITSFVMTISTFGPVALMLDDLHWADSASIDLLAYLARHTRDRRVLLFGTFRDREVAQLPSLQGALHDLGREDLLQRIAVLGLGVDGTADLMATSMGGAGIPAGLAQLVHSRTEGNAFFVQQVVRDLIERGAVSGADEDWGHREIEVPATIRSATEYRLSRLEQQTRQVLQAASVLGQAFSFEDLHAVTGGADGDLEASLDEARLAGLVQESDADNYAFDHVLTQQALYEGLSGRQRRKLHLAAGEALETLPERPRKRRTAELAWHFRHGNDAERACAWTMRAGEHAEAVFASKEAERHYRTAVHLAGELGDNDREVEALEKLGDALHSLARYQEELDVLLAAIAVHRENGNRESEMRLAAALGWASFEVGRRDAGIEVLIPVIDQWRHTGGTPSSASAALHVSLGNLYWADGRLDDALALFVRAAELAQAVGDSRSLGLAESLWAATLVSLGRIDEALTAFDLSISIADAAGDLDSLCRSLAYRGWVHGMYRNDWNLFKRDAERYTEVARKLGNPAQIAGALGALGERFWVEGDWTRGQELLDEAAQIARQLAPSRSSWFIALAALTRMLGGQIPPSTRELEECVRIGEQQKDTTLVAMASQLLADWDLDCGRPENARRRVESVIDAPDFADRTRDRYRQVLASALALEGEIERAEELVDENLAEARSTGAPLSVALWSQSRGLVRTQQGRWEEASAAFQEALGIFRSQGNVVYESRVRHMCGQMEALRGEREAARRHFEDELALLRAMGATALIEKAERAMDRLR